MTARPPRPSTFSPGAPGHADGDIPAAAREIYLEIIQKWPESVYAEASRLYAAQCLVALGKIEEAKRELAARRERRPGRAKNFLCGRWAMIESRHLPSPRLPTSPRLRRTGRRAGVVGVPFPRVLLLLRLPFGLPPQQQRERYPWRQFHLIPGWKLSSAWGQTKGGKVKSILLSLIALLLAPLAATHAADFHVAPSGNDANPGTQAAPFRTIQHAANLAQPGDGITVHEGIYRERVTPPRGGESDAKRIVYQAASGEKVEIRGSEVVKNWGKVQDDVWKVTLPNAFFGNFNPYSDLIHGDWFKGRERKHHTGSVYLNGEWLDEAAKMEDVLKPAGNTPLWFGEVDQENTTIWAQFKGVNPNEQLVEINVRRTVFYPKKPGINYITVRGFDLRNAATPWAPPTAEQIGLIGTHWSKGWIIENNVISHSRCTGVTLGKYGDEWDNKAGSAQGYVGTINRALENGWSRENIGHHIVRNNIISHCEQAGIVGSLGAVFSTITGNVIHDIHVRRLFSGAEMAGIKIHAAIDTVISNNHIYRTTRGIWLDWMAQGTRVTRNLLHDNGQDLFVEVNHGPFLVDNNVFLSKTSVLDWSEGGAYVHNLFAGGFGLRPQGRHTPFHKPHSTEVAGLHNIPGGDDRYYNNLFVERGNLGQYDGARLPVWMDGNVFLKGARPSKHETKPLLKPESDPEVKLVEKADGFYIEIKFDKAWSAERTRKLVTTELLGKAAIPNLPYEQPDGTPIRVNTDYFGKSRNESNPTPGPFENPGAGLLILKVW